MSGMPGSYNGVQEHVVGKTGCLPMEPDSTVNFYHHSNQTRMYHPSHNDTQQYACYHPDRPIEERTKKELQLKNEISHPGTPEKYNPQASPIKLQHHLNHCSAVPSLPSPHHLNAFQDVNGKLQEETSTPFAALHHQHPSYHNNNREWPVQSVCHPEHQPNHPAPSHIDIHPQSSYPSLSTFGHHNGQPNAYHETHFGHPSPHINHAGYNEIYNNQH